MTIITSVLGEGFVEGEPHVVENDLDSVEGGDLALEQVVSTHTDANDVIIRNQLERQRNLNNGSTREDVLARNACEIVELTERDRKRPSRS